MESTTQTMLDAGTAELATQSKVVDIDVHLPILRRWPVGMARRANVAEHFLYTSCSSYVSSVAVQYMRRQKELMQQQRGGFVLKRDSQHSAMDRCSSMVACSFRMFRTGRVILLHDLLNMAKADSIPDIAMIAVPDFYADSADLSDYERKLIMHFLNSQYLNQKATVLYVSNMRNLHQHYGDQIFNHINSSYHVEK